MTPTTSPLAYSPTPVPGDAKFKISPSAFAKFIQTPHNWYRDEVLKENPFSYNTASVIGTCVHYCAEKVAKQEHVDIEAIEEYINSLESTDEYDPRVVRESYIEMAEVLVNDYVNQQNDILEVETSHVLELDRGYWVGGTVDLLQGTKAECMISDYKTYNSKTKPRSIPQNYKYQLLVYAYVLKQLGYGVTRIRLVYVNRHIEGEISEKTGKQMKSYPPEVTVLTESIGEEDMLFIESLLYLSIDSLKAAEKHPELLHVIFHDPRLKQ